ncbi:penicillin-binding transpeptidase domain-containing protein [Vagococcus teuberi]|uniref:Cell division protein FtsI n=1 Tax=Vagococcus teuberi TaxID=519472 RepID=A0A1J0A6C2_9ENTE|nr:penicillin-binding transpeptidase domain-containing protein [Vagococcus teuberi]APB31476.1 hypothetical protein BHY08_06310 [Vagococcus teuberi]
MNQRNKGKFLSSKNKQTKKTKSHVPIRLDILFFIVFILFTMLIVKLSDLQIKNQEKYKNIVASGQKKIVEENAPRGYIYDSKGNILVGNKATQAILFTRSAGMNANDIRKVSQDIVKLIDIEPDKLTERDKKDYWLANPDNLAKAQKRLTVSDKVSSNGQELSNSDLYAKTVDKVNDDEINFDEQQMKEASVFKRINSAAALQPVTIKNDNVTPEEIAKVGENTAAISGLSAGTDWKRDYPEKDQIRSILGTVSTEKQGLPEDEIDEYLKKGYQRNDRVGLSYLEKSYEDTLKGKKGQSEVVTDKNQKIVSKTEVKASEKGDNLMLTINLDFQRKVEEIAKRQFESLEQAGKATYSPGVYVVVTDPNNGDVLSMVGLSKDPDTGELIDDSLGTINKAFVPGSSIKAATVMAGYENGIIKGNQTMVDEPLVFSDGTTKSSLFNHYSSIPLTTEQALEVSSNVYMMRIALGMMGVEYSPGMSLPMDISVFDKLRKTYEEFGLGTKTGIDIPQESVGVLNTNYKDKNGNFLPGIMANALDLSFGNYEAYTPMQLAQYVSTIANGGTRYAPHVVKGIYGNGDNGDLGKEKELIEPKVMNKIEGKENEFEIIQEGMYQVVNGSMGTGTVLQGASLPIAAKTGTAETFAVDPKTNKTISVINSTIVGYAPYNDPKVAVSVMIPQISDDDMATNRLILKEVINAYNEEYNKQ